MRSSCPRILVIGGGLAGMAAAVALQSAGVQVTLVEARRSLGGRAGSFQHPQTSEMLDNCQHVLLGCCTNLIDFYRRLGVSRKIRWSGPVRFVDDSGRGHILRSWPGIPAPLHLALGGAAFTALDPADRRALGGAMFAMLRLGRKGYAALADVSFGDWLAQHGQGKTLIDRFYDIVLVSALNEKSSLVSARYAIQVFYDGMLSHRDGYRMGVPACPLQELYAAIPCRDVRLGLRVAGLRFSCDGVIGAESSDGQFLPADAVVLAVPYQTLEKLLPAERLACDARFAGLGAFSPSPGTPGEGRGGGNLEAAIGEQARRLPSPHPNPPPEYQGRGQDGQRLESVPILGAHLRFDRPVLRHAQVALLGGPLQWLFRKSDDARALHGVISAARDWVNVPRESALASFVGQIRRVLPAARDAKLLHGTIVVEKRATFSPRPGVDALRPWQSPPAGGIGGLFLAGDYTQTGWPATMEGAVRSGYLAAEAVLKSPGRFLVADLPVEWPARMLGKRRR